jgi:predicted nucleic acid-binding protein
MSPCYWDTSALLALLFQEPASALARRAVDENGLPGFTSFFTFIELESGFARRIAEGALPREELARMRLEARSLENALSIVWPDPDIVGEARRQVAALALRPADAEQHACAQAAAKAEPKLRLASFDRRLNEAAQAVGLALAW